MKWNTCEAIGCRADAIVNAVFCLRHRGMVQSDTLRLLERAFRPAARVQSKRFRDLLELAQREILYFQTEGHPLPRDRAFQWDEPKERL